MNADAISAETTVDQALAANPAVAKLLIARRTACVGCSMARFCTLRDASKYYALPLDGFIEELRHAGSDIIGFRGGTDA